MSGTAAPVRLSLEKYQQVWSESACEVLSQIAGDPFKGEVASAPEISAQAPEATAVYLQFALGTPFKAEQAIVVSATDGLRLSQLLMGEPLEGDAALDSDHSDALVELFRQIAGSAALALGSAVGEEVEVKLAGNERPAWLPSSPHGFRIQLAGSQTPVLSLGVQLSPELNAALASSAPEAAQVEKEAALSRTPRESSLDFLRDIELTVTLRFGKRHLLLRDIFEIIPGSVVELDQQVQEPVELLVGKKIIARGQVVVVDGNYGLQISEIVSPAERLDSLKN